MVFYKMPCWQLLFHSANDHWFPAPECPPRPLERGACLASVLQSSEG